MILYDNNGKKVKSTTIKSSYSTSTSFSNMKDKVYSVKARSFMTYNGQKYYSDWANIYCLNQARIKKVKVSGSKLNVNWGKIAGATGYRIYVSTKKGSGFKKVATVSKNKSSKNSSGALYYWNTKTSAVGYLL